MITKPIVTLKGMRDGIAVDIDDKANFTSVTEMLRQKVLDGKRFFADSNTKVFFRGRKLAPEEENTLTEIITQVTGVTIASRPTESITESAPEPILQTENTAPPSKVPLPKKNHTESVCAFYRGGLRSGQSIKFNGSVVVMGDVNPGSEVVADGNVVIMGSLKGLAHAGAAGDITCIVSANIMQPVQLRIAGIISSMPAAAGIKAEFKPSYAYVKDGKINIAAL